MSTYRSDGEKSLMANDLWVFQGKSSTKVCRPVVRVAAYCRVSTDQEAQETSYQIQMEAFRTQIADHEGWELAGIYSDKGSSGLRASARPGFMKMIEDAVGGRFDRILVKSVSRFSRNTVDLLEYVRLLRKHHVYVWFDEQKLDTSNEVTELILTIHASFAQEESRSISENRKRGVRSRFALGQPDWIALYGMRLLADGTWGYEEKEMGNVMRMFRMTLDGFSLPEICDALNSDGIRTRRGSLWFPRQVSGILHNEKFIGDVIMQKYYAPHILSDVKRNDKGELPRYWSRGHHEALIDREDFKDVQYILLTKDLHRGCSQYPYYGFLRCPYCGGPMVSCYMFEHRHGNTWVCAGEDNGSPLQGERSHCPPTGIRQDYVDENFWKCFDARKGDRPAWFSDEIHRLRHHRMNVPYIVLRRMVDRISFIREDGRYGWDRMVVEWSDGEVTSVSIEYRRNVDRPTAMPGYRDGGYYADGRRMPGRNGGSAYNAYRGVCMLIDYIREIRIYDNPRQRICEWLPEMGTIDLPVVLSPQTIKKKDGIWK